MEIAVSTEQRNTVMAYHEVALSSETEKINVQCSESRDWSMQLEQIKQVSIWDGKRKMQDWRQKVQIDGKFHVLCFNFLQMTKVLKQFETKPRVEIVSPEIRLIWCQDWRHPYTVPIARAGPKSRELEISEFKNMQEMKVIELPPAEWPVPIASAPKNDDSPSFWVEN